MVDIQVGKGQGLTQAVATKLGLTKEECKNIDLTVWQQVVQEINNEQQNINEHNRTNPNDPQASIFSGGNDVSTIDQKQNWKSNFIIHEGSFSLSEDSWDKISGLLGKPVEKPQPEEKPPEAKPEEKPEEKPEVEIKPEKKPAEGKILKRSVDGEETQISVRRNERGQKVRHEVNPDGTEGAVLAATRTFGKNKYISGDFPPETKIYERTVNGNKNTQIGVFIDENGDKVRKEVIKDETTGKYKLGETLIPVTTFGQNTYVTQSQFDAQIKQDLNLPDGKGLPDGITAKYKNGKIVYSKNGKELPDGALKSALAQTEGYGKPEKPTTPTNPIGGTSGSEPPSHNRGFGMFLNTVTSNWRNGSTGMYEFNGANYRYTCVTSNDGTKAYKINGRYYALSDIGHPDILKELDKSKFE